MNKSLITNLISILFILVGYIFQNQYSNIFYSIGFFALSGSVTNWLAVQMLFEKVPFLYGSGVILDRFLDIKEGIKNLVLEELFSDDKINQFFEVCCLNKFSIFMWHLMAFPFVEICQGGVFVKHFSPKTLGHLP